MRGAERLVARMLKGKRPRTQPANPYRHATALLTSTLGTKVSIETRARGDKGRIVIDYHSKEDLTRLVDWLARTDAVDGKTMKGQKPDPPLTVMGPGTYYDGDLTFEGRVRVDGHFEGRLYTEDVLEVGTDGRIDKGMMSPEPSYRDESRGRSVCVITLWSRVRV